MRWGGSKVLNEIFYSFFIFFTLMASLREELVSGSSGICVAEDELFEKFLPTDTVLQVFWPNKNYLQVTPEVEIYDGVLEAIRDHPPHPNDYSAYKILQVPFSHDSLQGINFHPHHFAFVLVPLPQFVRKFCPGYSDRQVGRILKKLGLPVYKGNALQRELMTTVWTEKYEELPLISVINLLSQYKIIQMELKKVQA